MIRKSILVSGLLILTACASSPTDELDESIPPLDSNSPSASSNQPRNEPPQAKKQVTSSSVPAETRPSAPAQNENQALIEAIRANDYDGIYRAATTVLSKNPNEVKALNALGLYHFHKGHHAAAMLMYDRALKVNPSSSEVHNNLGLTLLAQKENREALQEFRKAMALNNDEGAAAANLGSIYVEHKSYTKALVANEMAYKRNSKDIKILNNYGVALTATGKYAEAKEIYKRAMALNGDNKDVMMNYAILLIEHLKQNDEGLDLLNKARFLGLSPEARNRMNVLENKAKSGVK
jgi:Tfp pilus assembly protein PilF